MSRPFDSLAAPLLQGLGWLSVDRLVHRETFNMVYKSLNGLAPDNPCQIFSRYTTLMNSLVLEILQNLSYEILDTKFGFSTQTLV